jgi:hypothetical protein
MQPEQCLGRILAEPVQSRRDDDGEGEREQNDRPKQDGCRHCPIEAGIMHDVDHEAGERESTDQVVVDCKQVHAQSCFPCRPGRQLADKWLPVRRPSILVVAHVVLPTSEPPGRNG